MWGTNDPVTSATFGSYTVNLSANSTQTGTGSIARFHYKNRRSTSTTRTPAFAIYIVTSITIDRPSMARGLPSQLTGLTPNTPYNLTLTSFDADASAAVSTVDELGAEIGHNTSGTSADDSNAAHACTDYPIGSAIVARFK